MAGVATQLELEPDLAAPARARSAVRALAGGDARLEGKLVLLTTELVTNSVRHAGLAPGDRIRIRAERATDGVRVEVRDAGRGGGSPAVRRCDPLAGEGGLGLRLLESLADEWGAGRVEGNGTQAWFVLR